MIERDALRRAFATLPPDHALAVHLRLVEGYPFADVARVMGRSVGACQMLVLRAGRELREVLMDRLSHAVDTQLGHHRELIEKVQRRATDPYSAADLLLHELLRDPELAGS